MFNTKLGLEQSVLEGRKTQTRRIVKAKNLFQTDEIEDFLVCGNEVQIIANGGESLITIKSSYEVGEIVAIAQSYKDCGYKMKQYTRKEDSGYGYLYSELVDEIPMPWPINGFSNKLFVKPELMPHQIRITDVRVERLQDISDECCLKEGIIKKWHAPACKNYYYVPGIEVKSVKDVHDTPQEAFAHLINKVSRKGTWESSPYVFVYDFELVK